nr:immunoglobulin light chain junction region [Macaca mulatta]
CQQYNYWNSF